MLVVLLSVVAAAQNSDTTVAVEGSDGGRGGGGGDAEDVPLVMVGIVAVNTARTLPNFLGYLEALDYPKKSMSIW